MRFAYCVELSLLSAYCAGFISDESASSDEVINIIPVQIILMKALLLLFAIAQH